MFKSNTIMQQHSKNRMREPATTFLPEQFHLHHNSQFPGQLHQNLPLPSSGQLKHNLYPASSFCHTSIRPPFLSAIRQNSSSSSSSIHLQSETTSHEPLIHESSSMSSSISDHEEGVDENELKLLVEAEIIDEDGRILRQEKLRAKDVFKLKEGEKILVPVNEFDQPIKGAAGLCTRFMTLLLKEPHLCPPDTKNWKECKIRCGTRLLIELRRRFSLPQGDNVDKVLLDTFNEKFRSLKFRLKDKLFKLAAKKLDEANIGGDDVQYTEDDLLDALDLLSAPENFLDHQWEVFKNNLRSPTAKKLSKYGKDARASKLHDHSTGAVSFARKKDEFMVLNKREANDVEFFQDTHLMKNGRYARHASGELLDQAQEGIDRKISEVNNVDSIDPEKRFEIVREVMKELRGPSKRGRPPSYGAGVKRSQVTKFSFDLRKLRGKTIAKENRYLLDKVDTQSKQIESQRKQIETQSKQIETQGNQMLIMQKTIDECTGELRLFRTAFSDFYGARVSTTPQTSHALHQDHP